MLLLASHLHAASLWQSDAHAGSHLQPALWCFDSPCIIYTARTMDLHPGPERYVQVGLLDD